MDDYSDLFSQHEPDPLLRELNGNILWYWKPMNPKDKRMGCVSNAPFEAVDRLKKQQEYIEVYQDQTNILLTRIEQLEAALGKKK